MILKTQLLAQPIPYSTKAFEKASQDIWNSSQSERVHFHTLLFAEANFGIEFLIQVCPSRVALPSGRFLDKVECKIDMVVVLSQPDNHSIRR
jgi:hypothetical protein